MKHLLTIRCTVAAGRAGSEINAVRRGPVNGGVRRQDDARKEHEMNEEAKPTGANKIGRRAILPPRPFQLRSGYLKLEWGLGVLLMLLAAGALVVAVLVGNEYFKLRHEEAVFADGVSAVHSSVKGYRADITSLFILRTEVPSRDPGGFALCRSYVLTVNYIDGQGTTHSQDFEFSTWLGSVDERSPVLVRYDSDHPENYALSWAVAAKGHRLVGTGLQIAVFGLIGIALFWSSWVLIHYGYDAKRASEDGEEVELQIVSAKELSQDDQPAENVRYRYRVVGDTEGKTHEEVLPKKNAPLFLDGVNRLMLGLRSPRNGGRILVMKDDLSPFSFTAEEKEGIHQRLAAHRTAPAGAPPLTSSPPDNGQ